MNDLQYLDFYYTVCHKCKHFKDNETYSMRYVCQKVVMTFDFPGRSLSYWIRIIVNEAGCINK